ncbi:MAG: hypothetical protein KGR26_05870, partial [Cyanobacteria bacterium REEB65]|nr:hypothetical protein [Cyanobacteria bacterium REEB65]
AAVLGCTHFPLLAGAITKILGPEVRLIDPAIAAVAELSEVLARAGALSTHDRVAGDHEFVVTGEPERFAEQAERILGGSVSPVRKVFLETLRLAGSRLLASNAAAVPLP